MNDSRIGLNIGFDAESKKQLQESFNTHRYVIARTADLVINRTSKNPRNKTQDDESAT